MEIKKKEKIRHRRLSDLRFSHICDTASDSAFKCTTFACVVRIFWSTETVSSAFFFIKKKGKKEMQKRRKNVKIQKCALASKHCYF